MDNPNANNNLLGSKVEELSTHILVTKSDVIYITLVLIAITFMVIFYVLGCYSERIKAIEGKIYPISKEIK